MDLPILVLSSARIASICQRAPIGDGLHPFDGKWTPIELLDRFDRLASDLRFVSWHRCRSHSSVIASGIIGEEAIGERESLASPSEDCAFVDGAIRVRYSLAVGLLVLIALLLPLLRGFEKPAAAMDEGSLLVYPELILKGNLPYRDFETFYGPANIYLLSGVYAVFGPGILAERATGLFYRILILGALFCIGSRWGTILAAGTTLIAGVVLLNSGVVAYAWIGGVACALWSLFMIGKSNSHPRSFFGGLLAAVALLFRPDLGLAMILGTWPMFFRMSCPAKLHYALGMCVGLLPLGLLIAVAGPQQMVDNLLLFPVFYGSEGRHLPLAQAPDSVLGLLAVHVVASGTNILGGLIAVRRQRQLVTGRLLLGAALFAFALTHQAVQRADEMHVLCGVFASLAILPISLSVLLSKIQFLPPSRKSIIAIAVAAVLITAFVPILPVYLFRQVVAAVDPNAPPPFMLRQNGRDVPMGAMPIMRVTGTLLDRVNCMAASGDRLFVGPADLRRTNYNDTFLYHMLPQLRPATYFLEMNPGSANRLNSRLASDVRTADWLILNRVYDNWNEPNASEVNGPDEPNAVVRSEFTLVGEFGYYQLFQHKRPHG